MLVEDRLFATLDPTTRRLALPGGEPVLLTDTVGFVRKLPHQLVEAFKSTLEVVAEADLLVHVVDVVRRPTPTARSTPCATVLGEIDAGRVPELLVFNKADLAADEAAAAASSAPRARSPSRRRTGDGIDELLLRPRRPAAGADRGRRARRSPTTAATSSPRCTARARSLVEPRRGRAACGSGPASIRAAGGAGSREFVVDRSRRDRRERRA